jgi:predicted negative regulator of RcsB-dependent stress response/HAMP domain-containing protein
MNLSAVVIALLGWFVGLLLQGGHGAETAPKASTEDRIRTHVIFRELGHMVEASTSARINFILDLASIERLMEEFIAIRDKLKNRTLFGKNGVPHNSVDEARVATMVQLLDFNFQRVSLKWQAVANVFSQPRKRTPEQSKTISQLTRPKRAVSVLAGVVLGVVSLLSAWNTYAIYSTQSGGMSEEQQKYVLNLLQAHEDKLSKIEQTLQSFNASITYLVKERERANQYYDLNAYSTALLDALEQEVDTWVAGLEKLLQGKLSPLLVSAGTMEKAIQNITEMSSKSGYSFITRELTHLYQLPVGFVSTTDGQLKIIMDIPMLKDDALLTIYEYLPLPIALNDTELSVEIEVEKEIIAINKDRTGFLLLSKTQLGACPSTDGLFVCPSTNYLLRNWEGFCISALLMKREEAVNNLCQSTILPERTEIIQTERSTFYVHHPRMTTLTIECPKRPVEYREFRGTQRIDLADQCIGHHPQYALQVHPEYLLTSQVIRSDPLIRLGTLTSNLAPSDLNRLMPKPPKEKVHVKDVVAPYWALEKSTFHLPWHISWGVNFSTTVILVGGACAVFYFCRRPAREILSRAPSVRDIQDAIQRSASLASLPGYQATMEASRRIAAVGNRLVRTVSQMTLAGRQQRQRGRDREANAGDDPPPGPERYPMLESPDREVKFVP